MGCEAMLGEHWQRAAICFGNAVEVAELEPARNLTVAQQRYLEAAAQMMAARRLGDQRSCRFLFSRVLELQSNYLCGIFAGEQDSQRIHIRRQQGCREINVAEVSFNERATQASTE